MKNKRICQVALFAAIVFLVTRIIQIPIPLGYFNIGNAVILLGCLIMPSPYGIIAGALGSGLADITSFPAYTIPTLIIKSLMPLVYYRICQKGDVSSKRDIMAVAVATIIPLVGYTVTGGILFGNFYAGLAQFPGLFVEYIANIVIYVLLRKAVSRIKKQL